MILLLLVLVLMARVSKLANTKTPTLVELNDGTSARVVPSGHNDRTPAVITNFVDKTMTGLMNWNAVLPVEYRDKTQKLDPGIQIGENKVTTETWNAGFGLSEDFREPFLKELANLTPGDVFTGETQSTLIVRYLSQPQKLASGNWKVDMVANLVVFLGGDRLGKAIAFNKTIYVRSVDTPPLAQNASSLQKEVYKARSAGLEIYKIRDLDLGR